MKADAAAAVGGGLFVGPQANNELREKLRRLQEENQRLQNKVLRLDQEPSRDQNLEERYNKLLEVRALLSCYKTQNLSEIPAPQRLTHNLSSEGLADFTLKHCELQSEDIN